MQYEHLVWSVFYMYLVEFVFTFLSFCFFKISPTSVVKMLTKKLVFLDIKIVV